MIEPEIEYTAFVQEDTEDGMEKVLDMLRFEQILAAPWGIDNELMGKYLKAIQHPSMDNIVRWHGTRNDR